MRLDDLPVGVLEQVAERPVQDPRLPLREGRAVLAELRTSPSRLDADQPGALHTHERGEHADRVAAAADARDHDVGIPADPFRTEIRDPHSGFIAYVPPGSIARGEALVKSGPAGKTVQCAICHGEGLKGLGELPRLAGLQPLYVARQLFDMRHGSSAGKAAALMKAVVTNLSEDDIIAISAYVASLPPH